MLNRESKKMTDEAKITEAVEILPSRLAPPKQRSAAAQEKIKKQTETGEKESGKIRGVKTFWAKEGGREKSLYEKTAAKTVKENKTQ